MCVQKLPEAGYPMMLLDAIARNLLLIRLKGFARRPRWQLPARPATVPYVHQFTYNLKNVVARHHVPVVLSASIKLGKLCAKVNWQLDRKSCQAAHKREKKK